MAASASSHHEKTKTTTHHKPQKLSNVLVDRFNKLSTTSRAAVFVLIFAVAAGSYFLFTSSAAPLSPAATYTDWVWPVTLTGYHNFSWTLKPVLDPSPDGYLWSQNFHFTGGGSGYLGLETVATGAGTITGKAAVFSITSATGASSSGFSGPLTGGNTGFQAVVPYPWVAGQTYTLNITQTSYGTWSAAVLNTSTGVSTAVGQIQVPANWGGLTANTTMWSEQYSPTITDCKQVARSDVQFSNPTADGGTVKPLLHYNNVLDALGCSNASITEILDGVEQVVGKGIQTIVQQLPITLPTVPVVSILPPPPSPSPTPNPTPTPTPTPNPTSTPGSGVNGTKPNSSSNSAPSAVTIPKADPPILTAALANALGKKSLAKRLLSDALNMLLGATTVAAGVGLFYGAKTLIQRRAAAGLLGHTAATSGSTTAVLPVTPAPSVEPTVIKPSIGKD